MTQRRWSLNGLNLPPSLHLCITQRHTQPASKSASIEIFKTAIELLKQNPQAPEGLAPIYGWPLLLRLRGMVKEVLGWVMDLLYKV